MFIYVVVGQTRLFDGTKTLEVVAVSDDEQKACNLGYKWVAEKSRHARELHSYHLHFSYTVERHNLQ